MSKRIILGVQITDRVKNVLQVQKILTQYGCNIKTRLGLHEMSETACAPSGLLILETHGKEAEILALEKQLKKVKGVKVKKMVF